MDSFSNAQMWRFAFRCVRNKRPPRIAIETDKIDPCTPHFNVGGHPEKATLTKMGVYFARAATHPRDTRNNIEMRARGCDLDALLAGWAFISHTPDREHKVLGEV